MAPKTTKKAEPKKKTGPSHADPVLRKNTSLFHFTCLQCDYGTEVMSATQQEALHDALAKHDEYHRTSGSYCGGDNYELAGG